MFLALLKSLGPFTVVLAVVTFLSTKRLVVAGVVLGVGLVAMWFIATALERFVRSDHEATADENRRRARIAAVDNDEARRAVAAAIAGGLIDAEPASEAWRDAPVGAPRGLADLFDRYTRVTAGYVHIERTGVEPWPGGGLRIGEQIEYPGASVVVDELGRAALVEPDDLDRADWWPSVFHLLLAESSYEP